MNPLLVTGTCLVVLALGSYSTATAFMIAGSRRMPLTFHGILGYSAFLLMATDLLLIRR